MASRLAPFFPRRLWGVAVVALVGAAAAVVVLMSGSGAPGPQPDPPKPSYKPRRLTDTSGFGAVVSKIPPWPATASLERIASSWRGVGHTLAERLDADLARGDPPTNVLIPTLLEKAGLLNYEGEPRQAYAALEDCRKLVEGDPATAAEWLYTVVAFQGVTALRRGETDNCVLCRGESSCILPITPAAVHARPEGSRLAVRHFTEYLTEFPDDLEIRWLLNVAHMTLGEHPAGVDPRFRVSLGKYNFPEHGVGKFRDIGHLVGINRLNMGGGAILDDFDNDGLLDIFFTTSDPTTPPAFYRNKGDGTFEDRTAAAGLSDQLGGLYCVQADYNNDGFVDVFVPRGAWFTTQMRPSLLRNNGNGTFTDVTHEAGLLDPVNAITAQWADFDNDGRLDLFVACENQPNRLYHNNRDGTFADVAGEAGVDAPGGGWKGVAWVDYDGDRFPDLFLNSLTRTARLYRNNGNGTFTDVTAAAGIDGPLSGFSCWAFDYDNDGRPDLFATSYNRSVADVVKGLIGEPHEKHPNKLYRNLDGKRFQDVTKAAGLDLVFATMGSNFGDFDNDGFLDMYLGTGDPQLSMLVPNRMLRNLGGQRFVDITGSSGTGHLQKGHGVAVGDWDRNGTPDLVVEMGGAVPGDRYHNILFQNPGQGNRWLNVKLVGKKTNRSAIGARIKVVTAGPTPRTVYRWVSSGSSFGASPLEQLIGLGAADRVAELQVYWPTSGTTQTFRDLAADRFIEVTEFADTVRPRHFRPIPVPH